VDHLSAASSTAFTYSAFTESDD